MSSFLPHIKKKEKKEIKIKGWGMEFKKTHLKYQTIRERMKSPSLVGREIEELS
jgi:hypothetical protein